MSLPQLTSLEEQEPRRLLATLSRLSQAAALGGERDLISIIVQAGAIWYDVDVRMYKRDLLGHFRLDTWLPGADLTLGPDDCGALADVSDSEFVRITSIADQERLGWNRLTGELMLLPIRMDARVQPRWLLVIPNWRDVEVKPTLLVLCQVLGLLLQHVAVNRAQGIRTGLMRRLTEGDGSLEQVSRAVLQELVTAVEAAEGRLLLWVSTALKPRTLAVVGAEERAPDSSPSVEAGQSVLTPERLVVPLAIGSGAIAAVELRAPAGAEFTVSQGLLAEAGAEVVRLWLMGAREQLLGEPERGPTDFEARVDQELAQARRFTEDGGLLVIDSVGAVEKPHARPVPDLPVREAVSKQLRASDLVGRLPGGKIGVLLLRIGASGVETVAGRMRQHFGELARLHGLPQPRMGKAVFPSAAKSAGALIAQAGSDAERYERSR